MHMHCQTCPTSTLLLYTCSGNCVLKQPHFNTHALPKDGCKCTWFFLVRFCVCMLHETFTRWLSTLHKLILAHHDDSCDCDCGFCTSCGELETLSIGTFMRLMLCPPSLRFNGSSIPLFDRNCIQDK